MANPAGFSYPPDDPADVAAVVNGLRRATRSLATAARGLHARAAAAPPGWQSADGDAALAEIRRLATLAAEGLAALRSAGAALVRYEAALVTARAGIDQVHSRYDAALLDRQRAVQSEPTGAGAVERRWSAELGQIERGKQAVAADLSLVSAQTARVLREATARLGGGGPAESVAVIRTLALQLPVWEHQVAQQQARSAANALDPTHLNLFKLASFVRVMASYTAWRDDPIFAHALLQQLGTYNLRTLLVSALTAPIDSKLPATMDRYYGFIGSVLGAGRPDSAWLDGLLHGLMDHENQLLRIGLGLALRHGTYTTGTIERIAPVLYSAPEVDGIDFRIAINDPLVGVMHALSTNPAAAQQFFAAQHGRLSHLLQRDWRSDSGSALGAALAATGELHNATGIAIVEDAVHWMGQHSEHAPWGVCTGLGELLGGYIEDVNHSLINTGKNAPMLETQLPALEAGPHAHFTQRDLAHALFVAMHSARGSANIYAHQAVYAAAQIDRPATVPGPSTTLAGISINYGRLSKIHQLAVQHAAKLTISTEADQLRNSTAWIGMAHFAIGIVPITGLGPLGLTAGTAIGVGKGLVLGSIAKNLTRKYYAQPLNAYSSKENASSDTLARREETATRKYVDSLAKRSPGGDKTAERWISSDLIGSGRDNVDTTLLPDIAHHR